MRTPGFMSDRYNKAKTRYKVRQAAFFALTACFISILFLFSARLPVLQPDAGETSGRPGSDGSYSLPIIMYHGLLKDKEDIYHNQYNISPNLFEKDLKYLKENHYTPIFMADLIAYVDNGVPLPENPIILTFDDGFYNNYFYAYPLLRTYEMKAVLSIIGTFTEKYSIIEVKDPVYSYVSWNQINEMQRSGLVEIQNHSYYMHTLKGRHGASNKPGESPEAYAQALVDDVGAFQARIQEMTGKTPSTFTYPFGAIGEGSKEVLMQEIGFRATLSCYEGINRITRDPDCLYRLKRILRPPRVSSKEFFKSIAPPREAAMIQAPES